MRIVHLANAYTPRSGGIRTMVQALGCGYQARGHEFVLVAPGPVAATERRTWGTEVMLPGRRVPWSGGYRMLLNLARVRSTVDRLEPDRIEVSDRTTLRSLGAWAFDAGIPAVMIAHERLDGVLDAHLRLGSTLARRIADRHNIGTAAMFDHIVTTTRFAGEEFDRIGIRTAHVPLGVDLEAFRPALPGGALPRQPGPLLVLCSRLSREKRPDLAVEALRALRASGTAARLVIAGDGPMLGGLRRRSDGLPVTFTGHMPDRIELARLLGSADVLLAPGPIETFGLAALEAMACGTPVVTAGTSAVAELVDEGGGRRSAPSADALAGAVRAVLSEPATVRRRAARRRAESFPWHRTVELMLAVHHDAATGSGRTVLSDERASR